MMEIVNFVCEAKSCKSNFILNLKFTIKVNFNSAHRFSQKFLGIVFYDFFFWLNDFKLLK